MKEQEDTSDENAKKKKKKVIQSVVPEIAKVEPVDKKIKLWRAVEVVIPETDKIAARQVLADLSGVGDSIIWKPTNLNRIIFQKQLPTRDQLTTPSVLTGKEVVISLDELAAKSANEVFKTYHFGRNNRATTDGQGRRDISSEPVGRDCNGPTTEIRT